MGVNVAWAGGRLLFERRGSIWSVLPGKEPARELIADATAPAASADGRTVLYRTADRGDGETWKADGDGRRVSRVLTVPEQLVVTRDGRFGVYLTTHADNQSPWVVSLDTGAASPLDTDFVPGAAYDVSPDGTSVLFHRPRPGGEGEIVICELPACTVRRTLAAPRRALGRIRWTPDGQGLAFKDPTNVNIMVQPFDGRPAYLLRISRAATFSTSPGRRTARTWRSCGQRPLTTSCCSKDCNEEHWSSGGLRVGDPVADRRRPPGWY